MPPASDNAPFKPLGVDRLLALRLLGLDGHFPIRLCLLRLSPVLPMRHKSFQFGLIRVLPGFQLLRHPLGLFQSVFPLHVSGFSRLTPPLGIVIRHRLAAVPECRIQLLKRPLGQPFQLIGGPFRQLPQIQPGNGLPGLLVQRGDISPERAHQFPHIRERPAHILQPRGNRILEAEFQRIAAMSHVPLLCFQKGFELPPVRMQRHTQGKGGVLHAFVPALCLGLKRFDERAPPILEYVPVPGPRQPHHRTEEFPFRAASIRSLRN